MALKTFVKDAGAIFTVGDNDSEVIGGVETETVRLQNGVTDVILDANIENIELFGDLADYDFIVDAVLGFQIKNASGGTVVANIASINAPSVALVFRDGTVTLEQTDIDVFTLNETVVDNSAPVVGDTLSVTPSSDTSTVTYDEIDGTAAAPDPNDGNAITLNNAESNFFSRSFVTGTPQVFTVADHNTKVLAGATAQTVRIQAGVTQVTLDANIERVELSNQLANYKFLATTGIGLRIYESNGTTLVATIPNINQNVEIAFTDGSAALVQTGAAAFTLGSQDVTAATYVNGDTPTDLPTATLDRTAGKHSILGLHITDATGDDSNISSIFTTYYAPTSGTSGNVATVNASSTADSAVSMDNAKVAVLATNAEKIAAGGITGTIGLTAAQFNSLYNTTTTHKNTLNTDVTIVVDTVAEGSTTFEATVLADMNTASDNVVDASDVTTVTGTASEIASVTSKMTTVGEFTAEIDLSGLTTLTLDLGAAVSAGTFDTTVFSQEQDVTINLDDTAGNAITAVDSTVQAGNTLKINGSAITTDTNFLTFDGSDEADGMFSVTGGAGSDSIIGGAGTDTIEGGNGSDTIAGGAGSDSITGGAGDDVYLFNTGDVVDGETLVDSGGTDTIKVVTSTDFTDLTTPTILTAAGIEQILITSGETATFTDAQLHNQAIKIAETDSDTTTLVINVAASQTASFSTLDFASGFTVGGSAATTFTSGTDIISITVEAAGTADVTGTSLADTITATAAGSVTINGGAGSDNITGGGASDVINGGNDDDSITGNGGEDTITGGAGSDVMIGGAGDDVYVFNGTADVGAGDSITEESDAGTDTLSVTADTDFTTVTALGLANVEQILIASGTTATFKGEQLDTLTIAVNATDTGETYLEINVADGATDTFANLTFGAVFVGGVEQDDFDTGTDTVTITVASGTADVTGTSIADTITATGAGSVTVNGGAGSDIITGGGASDVINGGNDDDSITGNGGEDTITGGAGSDVMIGGAGDDVYVFNGTADVGAGDSITEESDAGTDTLSVTADTDFTTVTALGLANVEQLLIASGSTATFKGEQLDTLAITVNATALEPATLAIDVNASDTYVFSGLLFTAFAAGGTNAFDTGTDTVTITVNAAGTADVTGTSLADTITANDTTGAVTISGGDGNDTITGGAESDSINGGAGSDNITGGDGSDTINGGTGSDTIDGGAGEDTIIIDSTGEIITINDFNAGDDLQFFAGAILNLIPDIDDTDGIQEITATHPTTGISTLIRFTGLDNTETTGEDATWFNMGSSFTSTFIGSTITFV